METDGQSPAEWDLRFQLMVPTIGGIFPETAVRAAILTRERRAAMGDKLTVLNPMGYPPQIAQLGMAPRPGTLQDKTVYHVRPSKF